MNKEPEIQELQKQFAVLEERMKIHESRIDSTLNAMRTDIERINTDAAKRNDAQTKWIIGVVAVAVIIIIGVLG